MKLTLVLQLLFLVLVAKAQTITRPIKHKLWFDSKNDFHKGRAYLFWGYNRENFSESDIHLKGTGYDFTLYKVKSQDLPHPFSFKEYMLPWYMTIPQYNCHGGFFINNHFHISFGNDHMKYVVTQDQKVKISGFIDTSVSKKFGNSYFNTDIILTKDFFKYEHTNGLNLYTINLEYLFPIYHSRNHKFQFELNASVGGLIVLTKTDVRYMGIGMDNHFHVSGICFPVSIGPRMEYDRFFIGAEWKAGYMWLPWVHLQNNKIDLANQNIKFLERYCFAGYSLLIFRK